jgi:uridylate kinase
MPHYPSPGRMSPSNSGAARPVVVSIGGSVLLTGNGDREYLGALADLLRTAGSGMPLVATTGGGRTAREYIRLGRELGLTEVELDEIGIDVTRLHARVLAATVGPPCPAHPPATVAHAVHELARASPVILGGTEPGHTTDGVASLLASRLRAARLVNATDVDGIYDEDPRTHPEARRLERISWPEFRAKVHAATSGEAGQNFLFDRLGADTLARAGIPLLVVAGRDLGNLAAAIHGRPFAGSRVE